VSLLDVGCGYGGLYEHSLDQSVQLDYCGIDVAEEMIGHAQRSLPKARFICADALQWEPAQPFDYVVCSGILTQKLEASIKAMDRYAQLLIKRMFSFARRGIAFNVMTTRVNFMVNNLYYRNPTELLAWCMTEVSDRIRLDHSYPLYEYTIYLYHDARL
jgi:SAM-dependent methyltransferase